MRKTLIVPTGITEHFIAECTKQHLQEEVVVLTPYPEINAKMKGAGLPSQLITPLFPGNDKREKFADLCMPGALEGIKFPGTDLEIWKVLGIDRLSFWYSPFVEFFLEMAEAQEWDRLITTLDIASPIPAALGHVAESRGAKSTAIQVDRVRYEEFYDCLPFLPFDELIVKGDDYGLVKRRSRAKVKKITERQKERDGTTSKRSESGVVVVFDKRHLHFTLEFINGKNIFLYPIDSKSRQLLRSLLPGARTVTRDWIEARKPEILGFEWYGDLPSCKVLITPLSRAQEWMPQDEEFVVL